MVKMMSTHDKNTSIDPQRPASPSGFSSTEIKQKFKVIELVIIVIISPLQKLKKGKLN